MRISAGVARANGRTLSSVHTPDESDVNTILFLNPHYLNALFAGVLLVLLTRYC